MMSLEWHNFNLHLEHEISALLPLPANDHVGYTDLGDVFIINYFWSKGFVFISQNQIIILECANLSVYYILDKI